MKYKMIALGVVLLFSTLSADEDDSGIEVAIGAGHYIYDDSRLDNAAMTILSLGYRFDKNWQAELIWGNPDTTFTPSGENMDADWGALRGLYHFNHSEYFTPYISAGVGSIDVYKGKNQVILGLGIKMKMADNLFWRLEGNYHASESDTSLLAMIGYRFGDAGYSAPVQTNKDSDGDGVFDNSDACPNSARGVVVDASGCEIKTELDSDKDGVVDSLDQCPNTPAKALVDASGCQKELLKDISVQLEVNFDSNKAVVKSEYFSEIEKVAKFMTNYAGTSVSIEGHTDSSGKAAHNQDLSQRRAEAVASVLVEQFAISSSRVTATGFGEDKPVADNTTAAGKLANRRVVAVIQQQVKEKQWK